MPVGFSFGECPIRIGTMHLLVAEGAVLEPWVAQIVDGRAHRPQCRVGRGIGHRQVGVALHAYEAHLMPRQHAGIRRPVRLVAGPASFEAHGSVLEGKGSHLIAVAFGAARFVGLRGLHLAGQGATVGIVTIHAGHGAFGQAVFVRFLETGPDIGVAPGAQGVDIGWFVESLMTQTLIIHIIRTNLLPFVQSRASWQLTMTTLLIIAIGAYLPYSLLAPTLGFVPLPPFYWLLLLITLLCYVGLTQGIKMWLIRKA